MSRDRINPVPIGIVGVVNNRDTNDCNNWKVARLSLDDYLLKRFGKERSAI